jgi:hypothetical protein
VELLERAPDLEQGLLLSLATDPAKVAALVPLEWSDVGGRVYPTSWAASVDRARERLRGLTPGSLPGQSAFYADLARQMVGSDADGAPPEALARFGASQIASAIALHLSGAGWTVHALPGEAVVLERGDRRWEPFTRLVAVSQGELPIETWREECARAGVADLDLAAVKSNPPLA